MTNRRNKFEGQLRIGAVSYLNTKPLVHGLQDRLPDAELIFDLPSRLADRLDSGELDVALVPSIAFSEHPEWSIVSDACIGCRGPVLSVKLMFRVPPGSVRTLAVDEGSRTSAVLAQILLHQIHGVRPVISRLPIGDSPVSTDVDAVLVIGDRAIHGFGDEHQDRPFIEVWDLGDRWCRWAELPFVFAMWIARPGYYSETLADALSAARDEGCRRLREISRRESVTMGLPEPMVYEYLHRNLYFKLDQQQLAGLDLYYREAAKLDLISEIPQVISDDCPTRTT